VGWVKHLTKPEKQTAALRGMRTAALCPAHRNRPFFCDGGCVLIWMLVSALYQYNASSDLMFCLMNYLNVISIIILHTSRP